LHCSDQGGLRKKQKAGSTYDSVTRLCYRATEHQEYFSVYNQGTEYPGNDARTVSVITKVFAQMPFDFRPKLDEDRQERAGRYALSKDTFALAEQGKASVATGVNTDAGHS
jgi:hypothetical protein